MKRRWWLILCLCALSAACAVALDQQEDRVDMKRFQNTEIDYSNDWRNLIDISKAYVTNDRQEAAPKNPVPLRMIPKEELSSESGDKDSVIYRLGHSSVLVRMNGEYVLTDPVFSDRASPVQWAGPKRFHPVPVKLETLPQIKAIVISHNHYDHLDKGSILALDHKVERYVVPMGVDKHLIQWGIAEDKIVPLNWWQSSKVGSFNLVATPAQHFSGRGLLDRDKTLWASWVIENGDQRIFFSGDTGYFKGFKEIGERYGPFDLTIIETGAYNELWSAIHMLPEQSVQAHMDLKGKAMLPVHNGTFDLALHNWFDPFERAIAKAKQHDVKVITPIMGERVQLDALPADNYWWRDVIQSDTAKLALQD